MPDVHPHPSSIADVQAAVRGAERVLPRGRGTKPALSTPPDGVVSLDLSGLSGVIDYEPGEFTFTALAGTRVTEVAALLAEHGQYLPFDPLLAQAGATLGGTVAAGANGPGRYRYGGLRDFILGLRYVDGNGEIVYAGGKVVKNAAGFDIPKLMVGSLGQFGALVEMTFKVFPRPEAYATLRFACASVADGVSAITRLTASPLDLDAVDLAPTRAGATLSVRLGGLADALPARLERLRGLLGGGEVVAAAEETALWGDAREFAWVPAGWALVKVPVTPKKIAGLEQSLTDDGRPPTADRRPPEASRHYSVAGQVAWIATPNPAGLDSLLAKAELSGVVLRGPAGKTRLGVRISESFEGRVKQALDPAGRFLAR